MLNTNNNEQNDVGKRTIEQIVKDFDTKSSLLIEAVQSMTDVDKLRKQVDVYFTTVSIFTSGLKRGKKSAIRQWYKLTNKLRVVLPEVARINAKYEELIKDGGFITNINKRMSKDNKESVYQLYIAPVLELAQSFLNQYLDWKSESDRNLAEIKAKSEGTMAELLTKYMEQVEGRRIGKGTIRAEEIAEQ